tara:strand:+ start:126 stop:326 length:201 start_codon:yes stop_codon:yes gene_type:complete
MEDKEKKFKTVFEVWVQGELGLNALKPVLHSIHDDESDAKKEMSKFLEEGRFSAIKQIRRKITIIE